LLNAILEPRTKITALEPDISNAWLTSKNISCKNKSAPKYIFAITKSTRKKEMKRASPTENQFLAALRTISTSAHGAAGYEFQRNGFSIPYLLRMVSLSNL